MAGEASRYDDRVDRPVRHHFRSCFSCSMASTGVKKPNATTRMAKQPTAATPVTIGCLYRNWMAAASHTVERQPSKKASHWCLGTKEDRDLSREQKRGRSLRGLQPSLGGEARPSSENSFWHQGRCSRRSPRSLRMFLQGCRTSSCVPRIAAHHSLHICSRGRIAPLTRRFVFYEDQTITLKDRVCSSEGKTRQISAKCLLRYVFQR